MGNALFGVSDLDLPIKVSKENPYLRKILKSKDEMTGWERVAAVFTRNEYGDHSPEIMRVKDATLIAGFLGAFMGGVGRSRVAYQDFLRQNSATVFETPLQAKKALQDKVLLGMGSGAFRIAWRLAAFTFMYMSGSSMISAYRGKIGVVDQVGGAGMAGFLYKIRDGPKAAVSGTVVGSMLGLVTGTVTFVAVSLLGMNMESANLHYYKIIADREQKKLDALRAQREDLATSLELDKFHQSLFVSLEEGPDSSDDVTGSNSKPSKSETAVVQSQSPSAQSPNSSSVKDDKSNSNSVKKSLEKS